MVLWYTFIGDKMKFISILACKISAFLLKFLGRGSSFPGLIASKIDKNILKKLKLPDKIIVVTGSSGKGSTTSIIAHTFREMGYKVSHNQQGGNQTTGITTVLVKDANLFGIVNSDVAVLEVDERSVKYLLPVLKPSDVVITNITRDQPPRQRHVSFIYEEILKGLTTNMHLYLNGDDPVLVRLGFDKDFSVTYYGLDKLSDSYDKNIFNSLNACRCPKCNKILNYDYYQFEDLGNYKCSSCDFKRPLVKHSITDFDKSSNTITIDKKYKIFINNDMLYNLYNTLAAFTVLDDYGLDKSTMCEKISLLNKNTKIFSKYKYNNRDVFVLNNKCENATTYNQSMLYTLNDKSLKTIVIGWQEISRRYLWDELSWLYDVEFEVFNNQNIDKIIVAGPQKYDLAVRLKYAGIDEKKIKPYKNLYEAKDEIVNSKGSIYAILNFDYLHDFNNIMEVEK